MRHPRVLCDAATPLAWQRRPAKHAASAMQLRIVPAGKAAESLTFCPNVAGAKATTTSSTLYTPRMLTSHTLYLSHSFTLTSDLLPFLNLIDHIAPSSSSYGPLYREYVPRLSAGALAQGPQAGLKEGALGFKTVSNSSHCT